MLDAHKKHYLYSIFQFYIIIILHYSVISFFLQCLFLNLFLIFMFYVNLNIVSFISITLFTPGAHISLCISFSICYYLCVSPFIVE